MSTTSPRPTGPLLYVTLMIGFGLALAAIRPYWRRSGDLSLRAECGVNLEVIADGQRRRAEAGEEPLRCGPWPSTTPGPEGVLWDDVPPCWATLGFEDGLILHGRYEVLPSPTGWRATCVLEVRGQPERWEASSEITAHQVGG